VCVSCAYLELLHVDDIQIGAHPSREHTAIFKAEDARCIHRLSLDDCLQGQRLAVARDTVLPVVPARSILIEISNR
jgi:hypothetical protein